MFPVTRLAHPRRRSAEGNLLARGNFLGGKCHCHGDSRKPPVRVSGRMHQKSRGCLRCGAGAIPTSRLGGHGRSRHPGSCPRCFCHLLGLERMLKGKRKQNKTSNQKVKEQTATRPGEKGICGMPKGELSPSLGFCIVTPSLNSIMQFIGEKPQASLPKSGWRLETERGNTYIYLYAVVFLL